ncbi:unnamed protein product [Lymnaea stagnalis]|uniref:Uncharacterized protein n=1 Tax=Lymnaea stagnalis TaxID=6523 RepID=A0AAV2H9I2_LYMST
MRGFQFLDKRYVNRIRNGGTSSDDNEPGAVEKKFIRGFRSYDAELDDIPEEKKFMRGLSLAKRDEDRFSHVFPPDTEFDDLSAESDQEKVLVPRFPGNYYAGHDAPYLWAGPAEKKFIRGFNKKYFDDIEDIDKRFMRGFSKRALGDFDGVTALPDGYFADDENISKRFMRGLSLYSKKFIPAEALGRDDFIDPEKRFMRGMVKRNGDDTEVVDADKRFLRGFLKKNTEEDLQSLRAHPPVTEFKLFSKDSSSHVGSMEEGNSLVKDGGGSMKQDSERTDEQINGEDKRFMRGLIKKDDEVDKRFMRGLIKKDDEVDKRFMRGLIKKDDEVDKRFMRGLIKKDDEVDKRFMRGLIKKDDEVDKRFMRGLIKKDDEVDKRFMRGLIKKDDEVDKRFMRGLIKKDDEVDKRFMRGLIKKDDHDYDNFDKDKRFMRGFVKKESDGSHDDKRFMRGLIKKDETDDFVDDKRFMRGLIKKDDVIDTTGDDKLFMRGLVKKEDDKRFMRGLVKKEDDKRFMRGLVKKEDDKRFMRGLVKKEDDKRFMRGLVKKDDTTDETAEEKRFMRGFVKKDDQVDAAVEDKRFVRGLVKKEDEKRFMRGLVRREARRVRRDAATNKAAVDEILENLAEEEEGDGGDRTNTDPETHFPAQGIGSELWLNRPVAADKRFMRGFDAYDRRNWNGGDTEDVDDDGSGVSKRFMRGFQIYDHPSSKRWLRYLDLERPNSVSFTKTNKVVAEDMLDTQKRFMKGLDAYKLPGKRFIRGFEGLGSSDAYSLPGKRFIRGFEGLGSSDAYSLPGKRFIRGFEGLGSLDAYSLPGKRFIRGFEGLGGLDNTVDNKRFVRGLGLYYSKGGGGVDKRFIRGFDTLKRDWDESGESRFEEPVYSESETLPELAFTPYSPAYSSFSSQYSPLQKLTLAQSSIPPSQPRGASRFTGLYRGNVILG